MKQFLIQCSPSLPQRGYLRALRLLRPALRAGLAMTLLVVISSFSPQLWAEIPQSSFTAKGSITEVQAQEKMLRVKIEGGLELTFHVTEKTEITEGASPGPSSTLEAGDSVEIVYDYNENFEKIAKSITRLKTVSQVSP